MSRRKPHRNVHVVPAGKSARNRPLFVARVAGAREALTRPVTQLQAIAVAIVEARHRESEVVIHRANGRIRDKDSYGWDSPLVHDSVH